jgi:ketosteroid isomerase-like protein
MKRSVRKRAALVAAVALGLAMVGVASAARGSHHDSETILENEKAWAKAAVDGDADRMGGYMADEYLELSWESAAPAHWSKTGKTEWVDAVRSRKDVYTSVDLHDLTVHLQGNLAVVTGQYSQKGVSSGKDISATGIYANTWAKRDGRWVVVHSIFP